MQRITTLGIISLFLATGCSIGKGGLGTGIDGCTYLHVGEGQLQAATFATVNGKDITYHKVNESCKDVPYHGSASVP